MRKPAHILIVIFSVLSLCTRQMEAGLPLDACDQGLLRPVAYGERENWARNLDILAMQTGFIKHEATNCIGAWGLLWMVDLDAAHLTTDPLAVECNNRYETLCDLLTRWGSDIDESTPREAFQKVLREGEEIARQVGEFYELVLRLEASLDRRTAVIPVDVAPSLKVSTRLTKRLIEFAAWTTKAFVQHQGCDMVGKPRPADLREVTDVSRQYFTTVSEHHQRINLTIIKPMSGISTVFMDPGICLTIFNNLIRNSGEIAVRNGYPLINIVIKIMANPLTGGVIVEYSDDGPGFVDRNGQPLPDVKEVLKAGFTTKQDTANHGIGLSIVNAQLAALGASIEPRRDAGRRGANFTIRFPPCAPTMTQFIVKSEAIRLATGSI